EADAYLKVWRYFDSLSEWKPSSASTYKKGDKIGQKEGKLEFTTDFVLEDVKTRSVKKEDVGATITLIVVILKDTKTNSTSELIVGEFKQPKAEAEVDNTPPKDSKKKPN